MSDIFISYSRKDADFVRRLDGELTRRGREAWVDWEGIRPTEEFMQAIYAAIEAADTFVFVLTPDSIASVVCAREIAHAAEHHKRMVPLVACDVNAAQVPEVLAKLNWIFCRPGDDFSTATGTLITALDTDLDWVRAHTRLLTRAIEWEAKSKNNSFVLRGVDLRGAEQWLTEAGSQHERQPTALQTEYIIASRRAAARRQRVTLGAVSVSALIALVLALVAWNQRTRAVSQERLTRRTAVQADFDLALLYERGANAVEPRTLAHLARALRTDPEARAPREFMVSLLRDRPWLLPEADLPRHGDRVTALSFSPDGRRMVSASYDTTARIWDVTSGQPLGQPMKHGGRVVAVAFNVDATRLITACWDKTATIWNGTTGALIKGPLVHDELVMAACFGDSGPITLSRNGKVRIWDAETGQSIGEIVHAGIVASAAFSGDGRRLVIVSNDGTAQAWEAERDISVGVPMRHGKLIFAASLSGDGDKIVTTSNEGTAQVWDGHTGQPLIVIRDAEPIAMAMLSPNGRQVITGLADGRARVWDGTTGQSLTEPMRHGGAVKAAAFSVGGERIGIGLNDGSVRLWMGESGAAGSRLLPQTEGVAAAAFSTDGRDIIAIISQAIRQWSTATGEVSGEPVPFERRFLAAEFNGGACYVAISSGEKTIAVLDGRTGKPAGKPIVLDEESALTKLGGSGTRLLTTHFDKAASVWIATIHDVQKGTKLCEPFRDTNQVMAANFSPSGRRLVALLNDGFARVCDAETGKPIGDPCPHEGVHDAAFSPDEKRIVTGSADGTAQVWEVETGKPLGEPMWHGAEVIRAVFSANGDRVVTCSAGRSARIWEADTGKALSETLVHPGPLTSAFFSPDGRKLLTISADGLRVWDIAVDLQSPTPAWVPDLAEALGVLRLNEQGAQSGPRKTLLELRPELAGLSGDGFWPRLGRWFVRRGPDRPISPDARP